MPNKKQCRSTNIEINKKSKSLAGYVNATFSFADPRGFREAGLWSKQDKFDVINLNVTSTSEHTRSQLSQSPKNVIMITERKSAGRIVADITCLHQLFP